MTGVPLLYAWTGDAMEPVTYYRRIARAQFKVGAVYRLEQVEQRSADSHRHYFAAINEAWQNMHEDIRHRWTSPEELRKWALSYTGWRDVRTYVARTRAEAMRVAKYLKEGGDYCRLEIDNRTVVQYTPRSQSYQAMSAREFQQSKQAVLDVLAEELGVSVEELMEAGRRVA